MLSDQRIESIKKAAEDKGEAKGLAEGLKQGAAENNRAVAKAFLNNGVSIEIVSKSTGLSMEELARL